ncbi:MAG: VCBS repeat-containing protein [Planctomycetes bacterium]|nr:VCBS repeat-containing protein [Planctomycetota bacterium]
MTACGPALLYNQLTKGDPTPPPPELSLANGAVLPLAAAPGTVATIEVKNAQIPAPERLRIAIEANGVSDEQVVQTRGATTITFRLATPSIGAAAGVAGDITGARLAVMEDDRPIAAPVTITLVRQPRAELPSPQFVSPLGQAVTLHVSGLRLPFDRLDATNLQMHVRTRGPASETVLRQCTALTTAAPDPLTGAVPVTAIVPGNSIPDRAQLFVREQVANQLWSQSTEVPVYYRPELTQALPTQGSSTGGDRVTLVGTALVPHDFSQVPAEPSFDDVELAFEKGGRIVALPHGDLRPELSAGDRLVFRMPPAADGRPGPVKVRLRVRLKGPGGEDVWAQHEDESYAFAAPDPFFGPRGALLDEEPIAITPITIDDPFQPAGEEIGDFATLTRQGGVAHLQLLLAQRNGMFLRFGTRQQIGDPQVPAERGPRDLGSGDFDGNGVPDLFIVNAGLGTAVHHVVLGQAIPAPPLGAVHRIAGAAGMAKCRVGFFDGDDLADVLLIPGHGHQPGSQPQLLLARPTAIGQPAFVAVSVPVRGFDHEAVEVADLDGDGRLDVAVIDGSITNGGPLQLDVAFGNGDGTFAETAHLDFEMPGYPPSSHSIAVGLHACGDGPRQSLALVLGGGAELRPVVATLNQSRARRFSAPSRDQVTDLGPTPIGVSLMANLDGPQNPARELVVAVRDQPGATPVAVLRFDGARFQPNALATIEIGDAASRFRALHFGRAFPADPLRPAAGHAVFAVHERALDGGEEWSLSTRLITAGLLLPPNGGTFVPYQVGGIVAGNWSPTAVNVESEVCDLAVARADSHVSVLFNDGYGGLPGPWATMRTDGLLPRSLQPAPSRAGEPDVLVFCDNLSRIGVWRPIGAVPVQAPDHLSSQLRLGSPTSQLRSLTMNDCTRVEVADVDGDGTKDIVALLKFDVQEPGEGDALLCLMRGKPNPGPTELPYYEPSVLTAVHGKATAFAVGDFAPVSGRQRPQLELALAVPEPTSPGGLDGDHVRFYRYVAGAGPEQDHFERSFRAGGSQVLLAGHRPTLLAAADFDRDGLTDLMVVADGDDSLRLYRNVAVPTATPDEVRIEALLESPVIRATSPGTPVMLRLGDVNGDMALDVIVAAETPTIASTVTTTIAYHLSEAPGISSEARIVSPSRLGNQTTAMTFGLGDWNGDGTLDLVTSGQAVLRVLFATSR